jgi:hypothetical protein
VVNYTILKMPPFEITAEMVEKLWRVTTMAEAMFRKQEFCKTYNVKVEDVEKWPYFRYLPTCQNFITPVRRTLKSCGIDFTQ